VVGLAGDLYSLLGNVAEYANGDTGLGKVADLLATGVCRAVDQLPIVFSIIEDKIHLLKFSLPALHL
jgi:hypothetical protein